MIGFTSFGGMSMIPLINDQMLSHGWMTAREVAEILSGMEGMQRLIEDWKADIEEDYAGRL